MNAGALQPFAVRQVATPLPPLAPKTKPPLTMCGITPMHFACCITSSGIPLSGIPIISCITEVAFSSRSVASSSADPAQLNVLRLNIASTNITFFMDNLVSVASAPHLLLASCCVYSRTQFRVDIRAHQVDSDLSKSGLKRSEQLCSLVLPTN